MNEFKFLYFFGERGLRVFGSGTRRSFTGGAVAYVGTQIGLVGRRFYGSVCRKLLRLLKRFAQKVFALAVKCCLNVI